jgi:hypothetical protein
MPRTPARPSHRRTAHLIADDLALLMALAGEQMMSSAPPRDLLPRSPRAAGHLARIRSAGEDVAPDRRRDPRRAGLSSVTITRSDMRLPPRPSPALALVAIAAAPNT